MVTVNSHYSLHLLQLTAATEKCGSPTAPLNTKAEWSSVTIQCGALCVIMSGARPTLWLCAGNSDYLLHVRP